MPWSFAERPSAALAALAAYVRRERPAFAVTPYYAYLECAASVGFGGYSRIASSAYTIGEPLYQPLLYPEKTEAARDRFIAYGDEDDLAPASLGREDPSLGETFDWLIAELDAHLDRVVDKVGGPTVLGLTTCFGQLFANLALAKRVKERHPQTLVVLGGSTVSGRVGPSLLAEYPFVDFISQGEGERPLVRLLDSIAEGDPGRTIDGLLGRGDGLPTAPAPLDELASMDGLPLPDFDEYAALADEIGLEWALPIEGSRGCWWDRTKKSKNPTATCYFCNLNVQWNGYREKSVERIVSELETLTDRYGILDLYFLDNIIRAKGAGELARRVAGLGRDFRIFYELRANLSQEDLVLLWKAGLKEVQYGIEGLSTSFLRRIGKGTTTIQNLAAMKTCEELGVTNLANLIGDFPGATEEEIDETVKHIDRYAIAYRPVRVVPFHLGVESTVETLRERFGITNVRNADHIRAGMPDDVYERIQLLDLSFDCDRVTESWSKVREAVERWHKRYAAVSQPMLMYQDAGTFLKIIDMRSVESSSGTLRGIEREVYLHCCDIRTAKNVEHRFPRESPATLAAILDAFVDEDLMFHEDGRFLSLALAQDAQVAARRILAQAAQAPSRKVLPTIAQAG